MNVLRHSLASSASTFPSFFLSSWQMGGPRKRMCSPNCVQCSDKAPAAGATGSFLLRSPLEGWGRRGSGAGLGRGRRDIQKAAMRKPKNKTSPLTPTHCSRQSKAARGGGEKKKKSCRNASECVSQTKKTKIVTTLLNLLLKTATNLSHSVLCQRVPNL